MTSSDSAAPVRHRRGRVALLAAAVLGLATVGTVGTALARPDPGPAVAPSTVAGPPTGAGHHHPVNRPTELTSGPLMAASAPTRVSIPALRVTAPTVPLGLQADGTLQVPDDATSVGWFTRAPTPGALGPAVLAGHVNWKGRAGTFSGLVELKAGDSVVVDRQDGSTAVFTVTRVERHPKDRFPTGAVYGPTDHAALRLITCGGEFDVSRRSYRDNVVVYARLAHG
jgi:hypothetical protein